VEFLRQLGRRVEGIHMLHVNSKRYGGHVAETVGCLVPLLEELGITTRWEALDGTEPFDRTTKTFNHALQGSWQQVTTEMYDVYQECNRANAQRLDLDADVVMIHDPQPAGLVDARTSRSSWIWQCHLNLSHPQRSVWDFLRSYVVRYDAAIVSLPQFAQRLPIPQFLVYPSIDPLSDKNREMGREEVARILESLSIPRDKPILLQVSRFDQAKDPVGVLEAYRLIKKSHDCRLVLAGGTDINDAEGEDLLLELRNAASEDPDIHVLRLPPASDLEINALQRAATIVFQKSTREGFGLPVAEALWKRKPVIGGEVGGITVQIIPGVTGYLANSAEGVAFYAKRLLNDTELMTNMGLHGREYARHRFLITRQLQECLGLVIQLREARHGNGARAA